MNRLGVLLATSAVALSAASHARAARAQESSSPVGFVQPQPPTPEQQAAQAFARGRQQYDGGQFDAALQSFREALELAPSPNARLYVGRSLRRLNRLAEAYNELRRTAQEADRRAATEPRYAATRETARDEASGLVSSVAFVTLVVSNAPSGAEVTVDGQRTGPAIWGSPLARAPGRARIEARAEGMQPIALDVELRAGADTRVRIPFVAEANLQNSVQIGFGEPANSGPTASGAQAVETVAVDRNALDASMGRRDRATNGSGAGPEAPRAEPRRSALVPLGGVMVGLGAAGVVTGVVFGVMAEERYQSLRRTCEAPGANCSGNADVQAQVNEGRMFDTITVASAVGGAALMAIGVGVLIGGTLQNEAYRGQQRTLAPSFARVRPILSPLRAGGWIGVGGQF